jgi:hypothetical protein
MPNISANKLDHFNYKICLLNFKNCLAYLKQSLSCVNALAKLPLVKLAIVKLAQAKLTLA